MPSKKTSRPLYQRIAIDVAGFGLMIISPFLGWLPGPGGIPLFLAGLGLVSLNHEWAENFLKDFDRKRVEFTDKYLMASPRISLAIDILCIGLLCVGAFIIFAQDSLAIRASGLGLVSGMLLILASNQKRYERFKKRFKHKK